MHAPFGYFACKSTCVDQHVETQEGGLRALLLHSLHPELRPGEIPRLGAGPDVEHDMGVAQLREEVGLASYVVEMELELSPEDNVTITEENLRKPLLDTLAITFPCNISISEGGEAADETARTLSLDLSRGSSRRMLRMDRRMSRHLLATVQFN